MLVEHTLSRASIGTNARFQPAEKNIRAGMMARIPLTNRETNFTPTLFAFRIPLALTCLKLRKFFCVNRNCVFDRRPSGRANERPQSDWNICDHKTRKSEHIENLFARACVHRIPFNKGGDNSEHEHEKHIHKQAKEYS